MTAEQPNMLNTYAGEWQWLLLRFSSGEHGSHAVCTLSKASAAELKVQPNSSVAPKYDCIYLQSWKKNDNILYYKNASPLEPGTVAQICKTSTWEL